MHVYYELKDMLHDELSDIVKKGEVSKGNIEIINKLLESIKDACKIIMYEEYSEDGYSYADADTDMSGYSNARGRTGNVKRDSRGRYSREDRRYSRTSGYSYHDDHKMKIDILNDMMDDAKSEDERRVIEKLIRRVEKE